MGDEVVSIRWQMAMKKWKDYDVEKIIFHGAKKCGECGNKDKCENQHLDTLAKEVYECEYEEDYTEDTELADFNLLWGDEVPTFTSFIECILKDGKRLILFPSSARSEINQASAEEACSHYIG